MADKLPVLQTKDCCIGYPGKKDIIVAGPLNLQLYIGKLVCLLGPNGSGKSTLLRSIAGLQPILSGNIYINQQNISSLKPATIALDISLVLTDSVRSSNLDAYSLIALGRYPYSGWLRILSDEDKEMVDRAISSTAIESIVHRKIETLSDGELQKVMLARALAQDTPIIILDEPTAHLDLPSKTHLMKLLHSLAKENQKAILVSTHDLDLALQVADEVWLMSPGGNMQTGAPEDLVLNGSFDAVFDQTGEIFDKTTGAFKINLPKNKTVSVISNNTINLFWTKRALNRVGINVSSSDKSSSHIEVISHADTVEWLITLSGKTTIHQSITSVINLLV